MDSGAGHPGITKNPISVVLRTLQSDAPPNIRFANAITCAFTGLLAYMLNGQMPGWATIALIAVCYVAGGGRATIEAIKTALGGALDVNFLMILAAVVSAALGHWGEGAILLFLFSLSDALERYAIERTRKGIRAVMNLRPATALRLVGENAIEVPVEALVLGDEIRLLPGMRFPVDGTIVGGGAAIDESVVTGESIPVEKKTGDAVYAGTINTNGSLRVRMSKPAEESTLARIVRMVEQAQGERASIQRTIERWQPPYVWGVLGLSGLAILAGWLSGLSAFEALQRGMALLVAASPCAIVLASPVNVLSAITRAARMGVLIKGGLHLETLSRVDAIAFDKTGTLTHGRPRVVNVVPENGVKEGDLLRLAATAEAHSEHPLARAVVAAARERGIAVGEATNFANQAGAGVTAVVEGEWIGVGSRALFAAHGAKWPTDGTNPLGGEPKESTNMWVGRRDKLLGKIELRDELRADAAEALPRLRESGIDRIAMISGDHAAAAAHVARQVGIQEVYAGVKPDAKLALIQSIRRDREAAGGGGVAMVGDGVNDAPALAAANLGIAMGARGTEVALDTADIVLLRDDLRLLADAILLARRSRQLLQQSLALAIAMIGVLVLATSLGGLRLPYAVVGHEGSTVLVVLNGLRLLVWRPNGKHAMLATYEQNRAMNAVQAEVNPPLAASRV